MRWLLITLACAGCYDPHLPPRDAVGGGDEGEDAAEVDAEPTDAPAPCESACGNGTCDGEVCVIDCTADGACRERVFCPAGVPCRVDCAGAGSCADEVRCANDQPCVVHCSGVDSCPKRTKCKDSCACDVYCTGQGACDEPAECPDDGNCRIGNGCTSDPTGCDSCDQ